jgi:hypothetical protein
MLILPLAVTGVLSLTGSGTCPSPEDVAAILARPARSDASSVGRFVELDENDQEEILRLKQDSQRILAERRLSRSGVSCADLAKAAAVIISAWELPGGEWTPDVPSLSATAPPPTVSRAAPKRPSLLRYDAFAAILGSVAADGTLAVGAEGGVALTRAAARWMGRVSLFGTDTRSEAIGFGAIEWSRVALAAGPAYRFGGSRWQLDLHADALLALVIVEGRGGTESSALNVDPGLRAGVRGMRRWGRTAVFVDVGVVGWLRSQAVQSPGMAEVVEIPRLEVQLAAGVAVGN